MAKTDRLNIDLIDGGQRDKETLVSAGFVRLDKAIAGFDELVFVLGQPTLSLDVEDDRTYAAAWRVETDGSGSGERAIILPAGVGGFKYVQNRVGADLTIRYASGLAQTLAANVNKLIFATGSDVLTIV